MRIKQLSWFGIFVIVALLLVACKSEETSTKQKMPDEPPLGAFGPELGVRAHVVRSVTIKTSGEISGEFSGVKGEDGTYLSGLCDPESLANFMLALPGGDQWDEIWVTNYSKGAIATAKTGTFELSWVSITFRKYGDGQFTFHEFKGQGTMILTTHDADPENRRMIGTMEGIGLVGTRGDDGREVDLLVSFDMDSSCGVKQ